MILLQKTVKESLINLLIEIDKTKKGNLSEQIYEKIENGIVLNLKADKENHIHEMEKKFLLKLFNVFFDTEDISFVNNGCNICST